MGHCNVELSCMINDVEYLFTFQVLTIQLTRKDNPPLFPPGLGRAATKIYKSDTRNFARSPRTRKIRGRQSCARNLCTEGMKIEG